MRTLLGWGRWAQLLFRRGKGSREVAKVAAVRPLAGGRAPLINDRLGLQTRGGAKLDQVDGTTCGSAVLVALAAWADPTETRRLDGQGGGVAAVGSPGVPVGFGGRYDARQRQVHKESTKYWPQALGTSPWGMVAWLRRHAPGAGPYRVRMVDDRSPADLAAAVDATNAALAVGRPVPLLVGEFVPRHYCLALSHDGDIWHVYEPSSGEVRQVPVDLVLRSALHDVLGGFNRLSAVLLPS
jgi:hypothetical protein